MLGHFNLPQATFADQQIFQANSSAAGQSWHIWNKRRGVSMIQMICIAGGASGASGAVGANALAAGGGGGGAGNVSMLLIPAFLVPDSLMVSVGMGGKGTTTGAGNAGIASYIALQKSTAAGAGVIAQQCFLAANAGAATAAVSGGTAGAAGAQPTANTAADCTLANLGMAFFYRGLAGSAGGTSAATATVGGALTYATTGGITIGGTGGGGVHQTAATAGLAGGLVTPLANSVYIGQPASAGGTAAALALDGNNGFQTVPNLLHFTPATGGGAGYAAAGSFIQGGSGGNGCIGCGGGGGGGNFTGATVKKSGDGGDGIVIISSW